MNTWTRSCVRSLALVAALCLAGSPASAAIINVPGDQPTLDQAITNASDGDTIILVDGGASGPTFVPLPTTLSIDKQLTIKGTGSKRPYETVIESSGGPAFDVFAGISLTLENLQIQGGGAAMAQPGSTITINQCLFNGSSGPIVEANVPTGAPVQVIITNSCFASTGPAAQIATRLSNVYIYQSTFIDVGTVLQLNDAGATVVACLLDNSTNFAVNGSTAVVNVFSCFPTFPSSAGVIVSGGIDGEAGDPDYNPAAVWPGQLSPGKAIETPLAYPSDVPGGIISFVSPFANSDFEGETRGTTIQVGADEVDAFAIPGWEDASVTVNPVGKGKTTRIRIETGFALSSDDRILIVPESVTNDGPFTYVDGGPFIELPISNVVGTVAEIDFTPTSTFIGNGVLLDGEATIMLLANGELFDGINPNAPIETNAIAGRKFVIDTVAPEFVTDTLTPGPGGLFFANSLIGTPDDVQAALPLPQEYPSGWIPELALWPTNDAAIGNTNGRKPIVLLNSVRSDPLDLQIRGVFGDVQLRDESNIPVSLSGFPLTLSGATGDVGATALTDVGFNLDIDNRTNYGLPFFEGSVPNELTSVNSTVTASVGYDTSTLVNGIVATWSFGNMPYDPNGWKMDIRLLATDLAGNVSETAVPVSIWWVDSTAGVITSQPNGGTTTDPQIGWGMTREGDFPTDLSPLLPIASVRLWQADSPGDPNTTYSSITGWSPFTTSPVIDRNAVMIPSSGPGLPPTRLSTYLDSPLLQGAELMMSAIMADEVGNVQAGWPADGITTVTIADLVASGVSYALWQNNDGPGNAATRLDTSVSTRFWHNRADDTAGIHRLDPVEQDFGDSRRIPLPDEDNCFDRVEGRFNIQLDFPDDLDDSFQQFARWELYEDGRLVATGFLRDLGNDRQTEFTLQIPEDIINPRADVLPLRQPVVPFDPESFLNAAPSDCGSTRDRLGDEGNNFDAPGRPRNRLRNVNYVLTIAAGYGNGFPAEPCIDCIFDVTPASVEFTVAVEREATSGENPVIVNEKIGN